MPFAVAHRSLVSLLVFAGCATASSPVPPSAPLQQAAPPPPRSNILAEVGVPSPFPGTALEGHEVGLLIAPVSRWGLSFRQNGQPNVPGARDSPDLRLYTFHREGSLRPLPIIFRCDTPCGPYWHHTFPMSGQAREVVGEVGAGSLGPGVASPYPLGDEAHLVTVEVNQGAGAPPEHPFTATSVRPVELAGAPIDVTVLLDRALAAFERHVAAEEAAALALYRREWKELSAALPMVHVIDDGAAAPTPGVHTVLLPSWRKELAQLDVVFLRRWTSADELVMENLDETPCGFPSQNQAIQVPPYSAVELGQRLRVSASGEVSVLETFPAGVLDASAQHLAQIPLWEHRSRRDCPELGAPISPRR